MKPSYLNYVCSGVAGFLFSIGLSIGGMTNPDKVKGFLNIIALRNGSEFIRWNGQVGYFDPSLAFVMVGALCVTLFAFYKHNSNNVNTHTPWYALKFHHPLNNTLDTSLIVGAILFGVGWALAGYCPGPALATVLLPFKFKDNDNFTTTNIIINIDIIIFVTSMLIGMITARLIKNK